MPAAAIFGVAESVSRSEEEPFLNWFLPDGVRPLSHDNLRKRSKSAVVPNEVGTDRLRINPVLPAPGTRFAFVQSAERVFCWDWSIREEKSEKGTQLFLLQ